MNTKLASLNFSVATYKATRGLTILLSHLPLDTAKTHASQAHDTLKLQANAGAAPTGTAVFVLKDSELEKIGVEDFVPSQHPEAIEMQYGSF